jgi:O-succinylbenzoic acid--CoA ligase
MEISNYQKIPDWLSRRVLAGANNPAVIAGMQAPETFSWGQLYANALAIASDLQERGVKEGQRIALLMGNSARFVEIFHALIQLKAVLVPLNIRLTGPELGWQLQDVGATQLIYDERNAARAEGLRAELPDLPFINAAELNPVHLITVKPREWINLDDLHTIIYSSGTTGRPKGVRLTYGNHYWSALASSLNLGNQRDDKWLAILPLFHVGGLSILFRSLLYGVPAVVHESFDPAAVNRAIDEQGVTIISVVATMLQRVLDEREDRPYEPHLRCMLLGGGPAPLPLLERCQKAGVPVVQTYGMTETASQFATLAPEDAIRKLGSAGLPLLPNALRLEKEGQPVPVGEVGEIVVRGPTISPGYDRRPDETARAFKDGWFYTGDLGRLDEEGFLYVVDRRNDLIISGGENVYPAEVESILLSHPAIEEAGVFGLPDERWGAVPVAAIKLRSGYNIDEQEIIEWSTTRLARYKQPRQVIFKESLPRNAAGKLLRRVLKEEFLKDDGANQTAN